MVGHHASGEIQLPQSMGLPLEVPRVGEAWGQFKAIVNTGHRGHGNMGSFPGVGAGANSGTTT